MNQNNHAALLLHSSASDSIENGDDSELSETPLSLAMGVGVVTALIGYLYSKCMTTGFKLLWNTIPSKLFDSGNPTCGLCNLLNQYPAAYIPLVMTIGGGLVATLSTLVFPKRFSAHDYVHILSRSDDSESNIDQFPGARKHLLQVMVLSLLTSISGFSLGPEAPMVRGKCVI